MADKPQWYRRKVLRGSWHNQESGTEIKFAKDLPRHLYKLMAFQDGRDAVPSDAEKLRSILVDSTLWLADPTTLDDPDDMRASFVRNPDAAAARRRAVQIAAANGASRRESEKFASRIMINMSNADFDINKVLNSLRSKLGVCSLSSAVRNERLWSEFGGQHKGIAVQFRTERDIDTFAKAMSVVYTDKITHLTWPSAYATDELIDGVILRKATSYRDQLEHRLVAPIEQSRRLPIAGRSVTALILGKRFPEERVPAIRAILTERARRGLPPVKILRVANNFGSMKIRSMLSDAALFMP